MTPAERSRAWRANPANQARRNKARKEQQQRNIATVQLIKLERGCIDCGYQEHAEALDFDHRPDESKTMNISGGCRSASLARILAEIEKCDVVCANCHRVRSAKRRSMAA